MKILIDGDNCNVIHKVERIAKEYNISCHIYANFNRNMKESYSEIHIVDCIKDAADFAIINNCKAGDIVITNDSGLAAIILAKDATPINTNGLEYTNANIENYLNSRYVCNKEKRRTNRNQVKKLPLGYDKYGNHPSFCDTLIEVISRSAI